MKGRPISIVGQISGEELARGKDARLFLLFAPGRRPDRVELHQLIHRIAKEGSGQIHVSHDPGEDEVGDAVEAAWLELVVDGLTFDCLGLQPGPALHCGEPRHNFEIGADEVGNAEAVALVPGPHLAGAGNTIPVVRTMVRIGAVLSEHLPHLIGFFWEPSKSLIGKTYFSNVCNQWIDGGPFPALGLTGIVADDNGAVRSDGLEFFTEQEVVVQIKDFKDRVKASQLVLRIVDALVGQEKVKRNIQILGSDQTPLTLAPSKDGSVVRVLMQ